MLTRWPPTPCKWPFSENCIFGLCYLEDQPSCLACYSLCSRSHQYLALTSLAPRACHAATPPLHVNGHSRKTASSRLPWPAASRVPLPPPRLLALTTLALAHATPPLHVNGRSRKTAPSVSKYLSALAPYHEPRLHVTARAVMLTLTLARHLARAAAATLAHRACHLTVSR
jgi:hypothetical protein